MPELPEVEFAARHLRRWGVGRKVVRAEAEKSRIFRPSKPADVERGLTGRVLEKVDRKAKYLMLTFDHGQGALSHLGMTGKWVKRREGETERFSRLRLHLDDGSVLHYADMRLFGVFKLAPADVLREIPAVAALGRDPVADGLDAKTLGELLAKTKRPIKLALMDQSLVCGLGNIHVAEALYRAKISPKKRANALNKAELSALNKGIHATIALALKVEGEAAGDGDITYVEEGGPNPFLIYGRKGEKCRRCHSTITSIVQGGRTTYFCPGCQKR